MNDNIVLCEFNSKSLISLLISKANNNLINAKELIDYILENSENDKIFFGVMNNDEYELILKYYKDGKLKEK